MPQKSSRAGRLGTATTQAIVRSTKIHSESSAPNTRKSRRKASKARGSYLPETKILRIQKRYLNGQNKTEIALEEKCDRGTVARIVAFPEVQNLITEMQQEFYGLVPDAMVAVRHALQITKDPNVAYRVLEATGVAPHKHERLQIPATAAESGYERQIRMVSAVLLESHENFGVPLPPGVEEALAKDAEIQGAKTSHHKLSRR